MTSISIRPTNEKAKALLIAKQLPDFFDEKGLQSIVKDLEHHQVYGAFNEDELIGFVSFREADVGSLEITWLAVSPVWQNRGVGTRLIKESLGLSENMKYQICYVKTLAESDSDEGYGKTRKFYKKLGFFTLEIISPYPGWDKDNPCQILAAALPLK